MNLKAVRWVLSSSQARTGGRFVLLVLAVHADADGVAWPSLATLARETGLEPRSVRRLLRYLEKLGELRVEERRGRSSVYTLPCTPDRNDRGTPAHSVPPPPLPSRSPTPDRNDTKPLPSRSPRSSSEVAKKWAGSAAPPKGAAAALSSGAPHAGTGCNHCDHTGWNTDTDPARPCTQCSNGSTNSNGYFSLGTGWIR